MKKINIILIVVFVFIVVVILSRGYFLYEKMSLVADWKTYENKDYGFELKYPENIFPDYNAPSSIAVECKANSFPEQCPDSKDIQNKIKDFNPNTQPLNFIPFANKNKIGFCEASIAEGAAGTTYKNHFYLTVKDNKCIIVKLVVAYPNCQNYLPLEEGNIQQKDGYDNCVKSNQEKPEILNKIISSFKFIK